MQNERLTKTLQWFSGLISCFKALILEADDAWYLVLDESSVTKDRQNRIALKMKKLDLRDINARQYEKEVKESTESLSPKEAWKRTNPISMVKFLIYSLSDIF